MSGRNQWAKKARRDSALTLSPHSFTFLFKFNAMNATDGEVPVPPTIEDRDVLGPITTAIEEHFASRKGRVAKL